MRLWRLHLRIPLLLLVVAALWPAPAGAIRIQFDYGCDNGFFTDPQTYPQADEAKAALEHAARSFEIFRDELAPIEPGDTNTWTAMFPDPADPFGPAAEVSNMDVPADTLIIFAGACNLSGSLLGVGGTGGFSATGFAPWPDVVGYRGQEGAALSSPTDFGPWGGSVTFNASEQWSFDVDAPPADTEHNDFLSVALHEVAHVLGFGTAGSWSTYAGSGEFTGPASKAVFGGNAPLDSGGGHWAAGTESYLGGAVQEAVMDPNLLVGSRKLLTDLDRAAMQDIGWEMPIPGDADLDDRLGVADYLTVKAHLGQAGTWAEGDFDLDGDVDGRDLRILVDGLDRTAEPTGGGPGTFGDAVPEPASATFALLAAAFCLLRRRTATRKGRNQRA